MTTQQKVLIGGMGGIIPLFLNLLVIEGEALAKDFDFHFLLGVLVRGFALFLLGGLWVWLHEKEEDRMAIFQLGMLAPALITAAMNGHNYKTHMPNKSPPPIEKTATTKVSSKSSIGGILSSAYAQEGQGLQSSPEFASKDGAPMKLVPAGEFTMGSDKYDQDERPPHLVYLDAFYIDKYEVTTSRYGRFLNEIAAESDKESAFDRFVRGLFAKSRAISSPREKPLYWEMVSFSRHKDYPVVGVTWYDANAYCTWAGKRLPTEAEWEKAARGTDERIYPWGSQGPTTIRPNHHKKQFKNLYDNLQKVGIFKKDESPYEVDDMGGGVTEWIADWYQEDYYSNSQKKQSQRAKKW